ncbi:helix-turn-helix domain-containing protein [Aliamphritea spongicola]|uniref:helix-turn-helix domain-containing protein n=1 Tax=Aliamphritea spongicola TaxID=707589 RepID=UPI00196B8369|nr:DNA-binding transcriptional regulator [Aliamphritea spongicola]MBN3561809.1 DNA-binding transcriptional regulator [Aliamphritea spongicola]
MVDRSILDAVHESAEDLHNAGVMNAIILREFDALCLPAVKEYSAVQIREIRTRVQVIQRVFAAYVNISKSTVQKWEQGAKQPNGPSLKLLNLVVEKGTGSAGLSCFVS